MPEAFWVLVLGAKIYKGLQVDTVSMRRNSCELLEQISSRNVTPKKENAHIGTSIRISAPLGRGTGIAASALKGSAGQTELQDIAQPMQPTRNSLSTPHRPTYRVQADRWSC